MSKIKFLLCLILMLLPACAMGGQDQTDFCELAHPIYLDEKDKLTPNTKRVIFTHDKTGYDLCGWERI